MTTSHDNAPTPKRSVFESAKNIADILTGVPKVEQEQAIRWVAESLGLQLTAPSPVLLPGQLGPTAPPGGNALPATPARAQDIRAFVQAKQPKSDNQFAAVVAYFYRFEAATEQRRDSIDADCLQEATRLSDRDRLGNPRATLNNAVAQGYLDRAGRGDFAINTVGENLVAMTLPGSGDNGGSNTRSRGGRKKAGKKTTGKGRKTSGR